MGGARRRRQHTTRPRVRLARGGRAPDGSARRCARCRARWRRGCWPRHPQKPKEWTTEADQVVGQISPSGTLAFFIFVGVPFGLAVGVAYALAAFILPRGMTGGAVFGGASPVAFGSTRDPLKSDKPGLRHRRRTRGLAERQRVRGDGGADGDAGPPRSRVGSAQRSRTPKKWWAVWMDQSVGWRSRYWQRFRTRWWRHCAGSLVFVSAQRCRADHTFAVAPVTPSHIPIGVYLKA